MSTPDKFVSFYNEGDFIRVVDTSQSTTLYFNKVNLSVQMDNNVSFYLKNDSNIGFYNYANVAYPACITIKELVYKLVEWAKFKVDAWDLSKCNTIAELQMNVDANPLEFDSLVLNNGTSSYDTAIQNVRNVVAAPTSKVVRQSKMYINYRMGQDVLAIVSGTLAEPDTMVGGKTVGARNFISRIGLYEDVSDVDANKMYSLPGRAGFFFEFEAATTTTGVAPNQTTTTTETIRVVLRRDGCPDLVIPQANWNIDKLNGLGPSVVKIDWKRNVTFVFEMRNRQGTAFRMGVMYNDVIIFCHEFADSLFSGSLTTDYQPSLPIRWEVRGNGVAGATCSGSALQGYAIIYGKQDRSNNDIRVFAATSRQKLLQSNEVNKNLMALSLVPQRNRCRVQLKQIQIINTQTGFARWDLILGPKRQNADGSDVPILLDTNFVPVGQSIVRRNDADDIITTGVTLATGFIGSNSIETVQLDDQFATIMASIKGAPDIIALRISGMYGTTNVAASISWRELI